MTALEAFVSVMYMTGATIVVGALIHFVADKQYRKDMITVLGMATVIVLGYITRKKP